MNCTFYRPEKVNILEFANIIGKMEYDLKILEKEEVSDLGVYGYVLDLCKQAKPLEHDPNMCFWGMDDPQNMPSDARCDFFYRPTYIATAFLMQAVLQFPELNDGKEINWEYGDKCASLLKEVLPKAMRGCTGRNFSGEGYDGLKGQLETMRFFIEAGTVEFIKKYPEICPEFTGMFGGILEHYRDCVATGRTEGSWGEDYGDEMRSLLEM